MKWQAKKAENWGNVEVSKWQAEEFENKEYTQTEDKPNQRKCQHEKMFKQSLFPQILP